MYVRRKLKVNDSKNKVMKCLMGFGDRLNVVLKSELLK